MMMMHSLAVACGMWILCFYSTRFELQRKPCSTDGGPANRHHHDNTQTTITTGQGSPPSFRLALILSPMLLLLLLLLHRCSLSVAEYCI
jgi:hypothetical protein